MTPEQKLKWAILSKYYEYIQAPELEYPLENIDELYENIANDYKCSIWEAVEEIRTNGIETELKSKNFSRHYEQEEVAMEFPDKSWVGWTYWYGGGKHGEPESIDWIEESYDLDCLEEEKLMIVRTFKNKDVQV